MPGLDLCPGAVTKDRMPKCSAHEVHWLGRDVGHIVVMQSSSLLAPHRNVPGVSLVNSRVGCSVTLFFIGEETKAQDN
jgi:hypothetical protein